MMTSKLGGGRYSRSPSSGDEPPRRTAVRAPASRSDRDLGGAWSGPTEPDRTAAARPATTPGRAGDHLAESDSAAEVVQYGRAEPVVDTPGVAEQAGAGPRGRKRDPRN